MIPRASYWLKEQERKCHHKCSAVDWVIESKTSHRPHLEQYIVDTFYGKNRIYGNVEVTSINLVYIWIILFKLFYWPGTLFSELCLLLFLEGEAALNPPTLAPRCMLHSKVRILGEEYVPGFCDSAIHCEQITSLLRSRPNSHPIFSLPLFLLFSSRLLPVMCQVTPTTLLTLLFIFPYCLSEPPQRLPRFLWPPAVHPLPANKEKMHFEYSCGLGGIGGIFRHNIPIMGCKNVWR